MHRLPVIALTAVTAVVTVSVTAAVPANASSPWEPLPSPTLDLAAGETCDFAVHGDPIVDEVVVKTVATYPDGSPKVQLAKGPLVFRLTNLATGTTTDADAGGSAVFELHPDGSRVWHVIGPVLAPLREGTSNIPRGIWTIHGVYDIDFSPTNFKTITLRYGRLHDVCADLV
ncbi:hypothetical protein [Actinoplanes sp. NPDC051851]|uniref:hypothetical protein n=1 Tax=Actinoplanes sp. NPDC051851 TaxID=3154753 RepID=UPI00342CC438